MNEEKEIQRLPLDNQPIPQTPVQPADGQELKKVLEVERLDI